jgi:hypothetical protein
MARMLEPRPEIKITMFFMRAAVYRATYNPRLDL